MRACVRVVQWRMLLEVRVVAKARTNGGGRDGQQGHAAAGVRLEALDCRLALKAVVAAVHTHIAHAAACCGPRGRCAQAMAVAVGNTAAAAAVLVTVRVAVVVVVVRLLAAAGLARQVAAVAGKGGRQRVHDVPAA
jgi:hypothetical protein